MQNHMGYLIKRIFINAQITNDHFIDVCTTHRNERLLWYCHKSEHRGLYGICLDEKMQESFFKLVGSDFESTDFERKVQVYFGEFTPDNYSKVFHGLRGDNLIAGNIPHHIKFDRESDPHVLMTDSTFIFHSLSDDMCEDCLFELIMNSVQEFQLGEAKAIMIKVSKDVYEISDDGSGIAVEDGEEFKDYEWKRMLIYPHLIFKYPELFSSKELQNGNSILHSKYHQSGYYKKAPKYHYKMSLPKSKEAPGSSLAHVQCYAKSMQITTIRGLNKFSFAFENGYCTSGRIICDAKDGEKGTHIVWSPDECCFYNTIVSFESLSVFLERQAFLNPGLKITLDYNGLKHDYCFLNGIKDYLATRICDLMLPIKTMHFSFVTQYDEKEKNEEELSLVLGIGSNGFVEAYHNYRTIRYGSTVDRINESITDWLNRYIQSHQFVSKYKEYDKVQLTVEEVKKHFCVVVTSFAEYSYYTNEGQKGLDDPFFEVAIQKSIKTLLNAYFGDWWIKDEELEKAKKLVDLISKTRE